MAKTPSSWLVLVAQLAVHSYILVVDGFAAPVGMSSLPVADIPCIDLADKGEAAALALRDACRRVGFFSVTGHGIKPRSIENVYQASGRLFDLPVAEKEKMVVGDMLRSRGWEMSPEHRRFLEEFREGYQAGAFTDPGALAREPSAATGILNERFCIGPDCPEAYRGKDTGDLFFPPNVWPPEESTAGLEEALRTLYSEMEQASGLVLGALARSLGLAEAAVEPYLRGHCSNLQVANYPSQYQLERVTSPLRVKAHADSGTVTLLIRQATTETAGRGGLQILTAAGEWATVPPLAKGAILVNVGNLGALLTQGEYVSTKHRVTNPHQPGANRRVSIAYFQKPDPEAPFVPLKLGAAAGGVSPFKRALEAQLPHATEVLRPEVEDEAPRLLKIRDLTRVGILHKYRHLGHEEASRRYHEVMGSPYLLGSDVGA